MRVIYFDVEKKIDFAHIVFFNSLTLTKNEKNGQVLRIAKFERFGKLDKFEKIWIDLD